jgi:transcriptional regulator with XRE-family HTH domain
MTGQELREYREELGLTQEKLAAKLEIDVSVLGDWEVAVVACSDFPVLLELALDSVDAVDDDMDDERFAALTRRVDEACARVDATLAKSAQDRIERLTHINVTVHREGEWIVADCNEDVTASQGETETEAIDNLLEALQLRYDLSETPKVKRITRLGGSMIASQITRRFGARTSSGSIRMWSSPTNQLKRSTKRCGK